MRADSQDVRLAKEHGLAGCILSNHGGRQLDRSAHLLHLHPCTDQKLIKQSAYRIRLSPRNPRRGPHTFAAD